MDHLFDFALLVISGCSALYCWTLSRRLRALQNLKKGMGAAVVDLTKTVSAVEANAEKLTRESSAAVAELQATLAQIDQGEDRIDTLLETMDKQAREVWKETRVTTEQARADAVRAQKTLRELIADGRAVATLINDQLITLADAGERQQAVANHVERAATRAVKAASAAKSHATAAGEAMDNSQVARDGVLEVTDNLDARTEEIRVLLSKVEATLAEAKGLAAGVAARVAPQTGPQSDSVVSAKQALARKMAAARVMASSAEASPNEAQSKEAAAAASPKVSAVVRKLAAADGDQKPASRPANPFATRAAGGKG